jgi:hypothetical protein
MEDRIAAQVDQEPSLGLALFAIPSYAVKVQKVFQESDTTANPCFQGFLSEWASFQELEKMMEFTGHIEGNVQIFWMGVVHWEKSYVILPDT